MSLYLVSLEDYKQEVYHVDPEVSELCVSGGHHPAARPCLGGYDTRREVLPL